MDSDGRLLRSGWFLRSGRLLRSMVYQCRPKGWSYLDLNSLHSVGDVWWMTWKAICQRR